MAALPASRNDELFAAVNPAIPETSLWSDALSVGMNNINPSSHVPYYLYNIGKVESPSVLDADFHAWNTPTTDRISDLYDAERMQVMRAIGLKPLSHHEANKLCYNGKHYVPIKQDKIVSGNAVQVPNRFIDEDVPLNMILVEQMGKKLGIPTPVTTLLIDTSNLVREKDFRATGTTMEKLGLTSLDKTYIEEMIGTK